MDNDDTKSPQPDANDAPQAGRNYAQPSRDTTPEALAFGSIRERVQEGLRQARERGQEAGRAYARDAVNATGKKIRRPAGLHWYEGRHYVTDQPVRAALIAAAGGAVLTAVFIAFLRGARR